MAEPGGGVQRGRLSAHTARRIMRDVLSRGLRPGDALADEASLVRQYQVSRGTLREALRLLTFLGAVNIKAGPRGGPRLVRPGSPVVGSALGMVAQFRGATLRTVLEARTAIESSTAALAAVQRKDADLEALAHTVDRLRSLQRFPGPAYAELSGRFHLQVAEASRNEVLATVVPALAAMTTAVPWRYPRGTRPELTERIDSAVAAIAAGDPVAAGARTTEMFEWVLTALARSQQAALESRILWPDVDEVLTGFVDG